MAILAASRDQAGKLLQQLTGYIKRSPALREQLRITQRVVHCDRTDGKVAVLAADADTLDGWGGTLALVDELGRHKSEENFGLLRDGLGPRDGQLVAFSTAGDDEDSALGRLRARAHEMPGFGADPENPKHKLVRADGFAFHEWSLDRGDDTDDLELVALANPASWLDRGRASGPQGLARRCRSGSGSALPAASGWPGEDSALSATDWAACADPDAVIPDGAKGVVIGGDLGYRVDCYGVHPGLAGAPEAPIILGKPTSSPRPATAARSPSRTWSRPASRSPRAIPDCTFTFDPKAGGEQLLQRLERELPDTHEFIEFPQMTGRALRGLDALRRAGRGRDDPPPRRRRVHRPRPRGFGPVHRRALALCPPSRAAEADRRPHRCDDGDRLARQQRAATALRLRRS